MKYKTVLLVFCVIFACAKSLSSDEVTEVTEVCCSHGEVLAISSPTLTACESAPPPEDLEIEHLELCKTVQKACCQQMFTEKQSCNAGLEFAKTKRCSAPKTEIGKTCCEECSIGQWTGETQGEEACGEQVTADDISPASALRKNAFHRCCLEAASKPETTTEKKVSTTTPKPKPKALCKSDSCDHNCDDEGGIIRCSCREGYRLQADKKSCADINECAEASDDLCIAENTVCHNVPGTFKCVPIKKRDLGLSCPPGFKRNVQNQVCDDINECQLPRPPCPKYLCENTIGGFKCAGKPGKPFQESPGTTEPSVTPPPDSKNDICPPGFRAGLDDECTDIDECEEHVDDCQRLSQHCINTHGAFFCQDHVSKRCAPGFKVNAATGVCEDIDECEESLEVCRKSEVCVNLPGAYNCKSKISTLPKLGSKTCQEGTRLRPGGKICEDIDECREGTHLCDQFQNCINTFGAHECRCKNGFELDSTSGSCVDIDECALKLDNCSPGLHCMNILGSFTCTRRPATTSTTPPPIYEYEYEYESEEDNSTVEELLPPTTETPRRPLTTPTIVTTSTTQIPTTRRTTPRPTTSTTRRTRPTTTSSTTPVPTTVIPTTAIPTSTSRTPRPYSYPDQPTRYTTTPRPYRRPYYPTRYPESTTERPETTQPEEPTKPETTTARPEEVRPIRFDDDEPRRPVNRRPDPSRVTTRRPVNRVTTPASSFDPNEVFCLNGFEKDTLGNCVDIDECKSGQHVCGSLETCVNRAGGYTCMCVSGFRRGEDGWCVPATAVSVGTSTEVTTRVTTTERPRPLPSPRPTPPRDRIPVFCELGFKYDSDSRKCIDIDECATHKDTCSELEDCVNIQGGYHCVCGARCRAENETPLVPVRPSPHYPEYESIPVIPRQPADSNVITVGAQYGQRGPWSPRPTFTRLPSTGSIVTSCPWGYKLTADRRCLDIDECAKNVSECGPEQRCENFYGGYSCQCPTGHRLLGQNSCQDIDECTHGNPCAYNAKCINTVGSYRCECAEGFRNAPSNDRVCVDVDECGETPNVCQQGCANSWGGYRCYCNRGYRLDNDNRTCIDVNECEEWSSVRIRGKLCGGECINEPGSYRCACPHGYRLSEDQRSCIDIDECESGEASCARSGDPGQVCQNTRGSYHCHRIECPPGYRLESRHRCVRTQRSCPISDWGCLQKPSSYSYNFITFVANIYLPSGSVDLFTMHGPSWESSVVSFEMRMVKVEAASNIAPADLRCFDMKAAGNTCVISLRCSLAGPQVAELELTMSLYQREMFAGRTVARLVVIVSQYEF